MAGAGGHVSTASVLRNWAIVYAGNFAGGLGIALAAYGVGLHEAGDGAFGANALGIAAAKLRLEFGQAVLLGVLCNVLVCLAVWLSYSAHSTTDRVIAVIPASTATCLPGPALSSGTCCRSRSATFSAVPDSSVASTGSSISAPAGELSPLRAVRTHGADSRCRGADRCPASAQRAEVGSHIRQIGPDRGTETADHVT
jgi:Formate/nitrite transporter